MKRKVKMTSKQPDYTLTTARFTDGWASTIQKDGLTVFRVYGPSEEAVQRIALQKLKKLTGGD
jgi:hypothetical protein